MKINVLLFAAAKEAAGCQSILIDVPDHAQASDVSESLCQRLPSIADLMPSCRLAVDNQYVDANAVILPHSEVALIPPVSGG